MDDTRLQEIRQMLGPYESDVWQDDDPGHPASRPYTIKQMITPWGIHRAVALELLAEIDQQARVINLAERTISAFEWWNDRYYAHHDYDSIESREAHMDILIALDSYDDVRPEPLAPEPDQPLATIHFNGASLKNGETLTMTGSFLLPEQHRPAEVGQPDRDQQTDQDDHDLNQEHERE